MTAPTLVAPCGCTFQGKLYSAARCTILDLDTVTGHQRMQHSMRAEKAAKLKARRT